VLTEAHGKKKMLRSPLRPQRRNGRLGENDSAGRAKLGDHLKRFQRAKIESMAVRGG